MIRKSLVLLAALFAGTAVSAYSQAAIYGTFDVTRISGLKSTPCFSTPANSSATSYLCDTATPISLTPAVVLNNSVDPIGGTFGIFYDFMNVGSIRLGVDARFSEVTANRGASNFAQEGGTRLYSGLGGIRASFHTPISALKPYVQVSAGIGRSDYGFLRNEDPSLRNNPNASPRFGSVLLKNNLQYDIIGGVDVKLFPHLDWRAVEGGYGGLTSFGSYSHNYPLYSLGTGIVVHFTR